MSTAYVQQQYDLSYGDGIEYYWWHLTRNKIILDEVRKFSVAGSAVLDVGCGRGIAVKYLRDHAVSCAGVELASTSPLAGVGEHIRYGTNAIDLPAHERARYTMILLLDVIEHLPDPVNFIVGLVRAFPSLNRLVVTVPACPELWSNYDECFGHYRRYTLATLRELAQATNMSVEHQSYFFRALYVPARVLAVWKRKRSTQVHPPQGWKKYLHKAFAWMMRFDYLVLPASVPGMSAIACMSVRGRT